VSPFPRARPIGTTELGTQHSALSGDAPTQQEEDQSEASAYAAPAGQIITSEVLAIMISTSSHSSAADMVQLVGGYEQIGEKWYEERCDSRNEKRSDTGSSKRAIER
jgi:hypothetical protein